MPERHTKRLVCACGLRATVISDSAATVEGITTLVMREHPCDRLRREPEPDEAAVEALADALVGVGVTSAGPDALGYARALIRHRGVCVEVPDAE